MKKVLFVLAGLFVFGLLSLGLVAACVVHTGQRFSLQLDEQATRAEDHPIAIASGQTLRIDLPGGDVRLRAGDAAAGISARITAWGATKEEAQAVLDGSRLDVAESASGVTVSLHGRATKEGFFGSEHMEAKADLEIALPPGVQLEIESGSGDVVAAGPFGPSKVHSAYGSVRVERVDGDLSAASSSGDVVVQGVHGKSIEALSGYGKVQVSGSESTAVHAKSGSGDVRVEDVRAERVRIESGYGTVEIARVDGEIEATTSSGDVDAKKLSGPAASLSTSYGRVQIDGAKGKLTVSSSSGDVRVADFEGSIDARSGYGTVQVTGVLEALAAQSSSGDVSVSAKAGSAVASTWKIASNYGRGMIELPADLAFDIDARTNYGKIERGFPVELSPGKDDRAAQSVQGKVHGGGGRIEIRCKSGDIVFRPSGP